MSEKNFKEDDYLATSQYQNKERSNEHPDFSVFSQDGQAYFSLMDEAGKVILRSEGYATDAARNKGIESVSKNRTDASKWSIAEKMGYYFLVLKAGNNQEIGRGGSLKTKQEAESLLNAALTPRSGHHDIVKSESKEDDYLPCKEYQGHAVNDKENNVALFKHENGQFYFVLYNNAGDVKIRSEGFETAKNRDQELSGVLKYHNHDSMYSKLKKGKYYMMVLYNSKGTEVGRSCLLKEEDGVVMPDNGHDTASSEIVSSKVVSTKRIVAVEDDYMKCEAYKGHSISDSKNNIALFTGDDSQLYFAVYNSDGSVRLRSEGFKTEAGRENELKAVIEHMHNPDMYAIIEKGKYSIKVLKDSIGREVARSCMYLNE